MDESTRTRRTLLFRLRDPTDHEAWSRFAEVYSPLVYRFVKRHGLQDADAADVAQEVFRTVAQSIGQFDHRPIPGSFRAWLRKITWCRLHEFFVGRERHVPGSGDTGIRQQIEQCPTSSEHDPCWEEEYFRRVFEWAAEQVRGQFRERTWQAFWRTAVNRGRPEDVARELAMSVGAVYIARTRVFGRLRRKIREIDEEARSDPNLEAMTP